MQVPCTSKGNTELFWVHQAHMEGGLARAGQGGMQVEEGSAGEAPLREINSTQCHTLREAQLIKIKTTKHAVAQVNSNWGLI